MASYATVWRAFVLPGRNPDDSRQDILFILHAAGQDMYGDLDVSVTLI